MGPVGFDFSYSICSLCPWLHRCLSVVSMLPAIPQFSIFTSPNNCLSLRTIMVEVWLFSSLLIHLLKNLRSLLSKHEKLAAESLVLSAQSGCTWIIKASILLHFQYLIESFSYWPSPAKNDTRKKILLDN